MEKGEAEEGDAEEGEAEEGEAGVAAEAASQSSGNSQVALRLSMYACFFFKAVFFL